MSRLAPPLREPTDGDGGAFRLEPVDWGELKRAGVPALGWLREPFLPARKRIWGVGPAESGKSLWAAALASALTLEGRRIVYVSQENGLEEEARRFLRLHADYALLELYVDQGLDLALAEHRAELLDVAAGAQLVVLDTLSAVWLGDEDSNTELAAFDRDVLKPIVALDASVLVLDHTGNPPPGRKGRRMGVTAPRGASSKGQKTDFLLEFETVDAGSFRVVRGKARGTHGPTPVVYRAVDNDDGTLELVAESEATIAAKELAEAYVDGVWKTPPELGVLLHVRRDKVDEMLAGSPEYHRLADPKLVGRHPNAHVWGTVDMYAALLLQNREKTGLVPIPGTRGRDVDRSRLDVSSLPLQGEVGTGEGRDVETNETGETPGRDEFVCRECGSTARRGTGNRGDLCRECARPDLA